MPSDPLEPNLAPGRALEAAAAVLLAVTTTSLVWIVPSNPLRHLGEPTYLAITTYGLILVAVVVLRRLGARGVVHERRMLTVFLCAMPLIYVACCLLHDGGAGALLLELVGLAIYGALAAAGTRSSFRLVVLGIAAHGLWDAAHYGRTPYVEDWYTVACFLVDVSFGAFLWTQLPRYLAQSSRMEPR